MDTEQECRSSASRSTREDRSGLPPRQNFSIRLQADVLRSGPLGPRTASRGVPRSVYLPGIGIHRDGKPVRDRLITRSLDGEDVKERAKAHDDLYRSEYRTHLDVYAKPVEFWHNSGRDERQDRRGTTSSTGAPTGLPLLPPAS